MISVQSADSQPGGTTPNEDRYLTGKTWALVLDGVTPPPFDGCRHGVAWFVETLSQALSKGIVNAAVDLKTVLAEAIGSVTERHRDTCDLAHPLSPAAQVALVRCDGRQLEWLVLGDCPVVWQLESEPPLAVCDDRADHLPDPPLPVVIAGVRRYPLEFVARVRNRPGGFWVASTDPAAANEALCGVLPADRLVALALMSDGLTRLVERYGWSWPQLLDAAIEQGIAALVRQVRRADAAHEGTGLRGKPSDDATGVLLRTR